MLILDILDKLLNFETKKEKKVWYDLYGNDIETHLDYPKGSMYDAFKASAEKYSDAKAYEYYGTKVNYKKLLEQVEECAKGLKQVGVGRKDRVTICMPNTPEAVIMFYAVNKIGATSNMIHPLSSEKEIEYYLNKSNSKYLLSLDMCYPKIEKIIEKTKVEKVVIAKISDSFPLYLKLIYPLISKKTKITYDNKIIKWKTLIKEGKKFDGTTYAKMVSSDEAAILYSGGTTGDPKGIVLSNLNFNALAVQCFTMTDAKPKETVLTIMPIFHGFGLGVCVHTELVNGMKIVLIPQFKASEFAKLIKKHKPAFIVGVPTMYEALISSKEKSKKYMSSVYNVICGGDVLNESLQKRVDAYLKEHGSSANIRVGYGLTESASACCLTPRFYYKEGGIGIPFPDMEIKVFEPGTDKECKPLERGEICVIGPTVMRGYLDDEKETKKKLIKHKDGKFWLHTEDIGYMDEQGLIFFESRLKRMIVSSGYNVYPQYIEKIIGSHPAVHTCAVIGIPHPYKHEVPKAYIVLKDNFKLDDNLKKDIKDYTKKSVSAYAMPKEFEYVKDLPKTLVGKVAYTKLGKETKKKKA